MCWEGVVPGESMETHRSSPHPHFALSTLSVWLSPTCMFYNKLIISRVLFLVLIVVLAN